MGQSCSNCNCVTLEPHEFDTAPAYKESLRCEPKEVAERSKANINKTPLVEVSV